MSPLESSHGDVLILLLTDIDGIKIRSDSEGGASKRSYNYRVRVC